MSASAADDFRDALRHFPSGVTIVTLRAGRQIHGLTVSAFASVSTEPPLIAVMIDRRHQAHSILERDDAVFAVNVLGHDQAELSNRFAWLKDGDRFAEGTWEKAVTGAPVLADAVFWLDCTIFQRVPAGTHTIFVGQVRASHVGRRDGEPLIYWNRDYRELRLADRREPDLPDAA